jgi:hypothetical protein
MLPADATGNTRPLFVATGVNGVLYARTLTTGWQKVRGAGTCSSIPGAAAFGQTLYLACAGTDHQLYVATAAITSTGTLGSAQWRALGGYLTGSPVIALVGDATTFIVPGKNRVLYQRTLTHGFTRLALNCYGQPTTATTPDRARSYLACSDHNGSLVVSINDGDHWSNPTNYGGGILGAPAVLANSRATTFLAEGNDHALWTRTPTSGWKRYGANASAGVQAAALN